jgi:hypothetical protein
MRIEGMRIEGMRIEGMRIEGMRIEGMRIEESWQIVAVGKLYRLSINWR